MPPPLDQPWDFGSWDNQVTSSPPWEHRGFWYHSIGNGDNLVITWQYRFDDEERQVICGDIYRCEPLQAILLWNSLREKIGTDESYSSYDGLFIYYGNRRIDENSILGKPFPEPLPNRRWL